MVLWRGSVDRVLPVGRESLPQDREVGTSRSCEGGSGTNVNLINTTKGSSLLCDLPCAASVAHCTEIFHHKLSSVAVSLLCELKSVVVKLP